MGIYLSWQIIIIPYSDQVIDSFILRKEYNKLPRMIQKMYNFSDQ